jgi:ribosomal protein S20
MSKIGSEISESALKATSKEFAQQIGKSSSKEAQELFVKRLGSESSQEIYELSTKQTIHKKAFDTQKSWSEKLKDKYHKLRL